MKTKEIAILIPAFNEEPRIDSVLEIVCSYKASKKVVVIDDGSDDKTRLRAERHPVVLLRHKRNLGKGAALQTGINHIKHAERWLFLDADLINLQHEHLNTLLHPLDNGEGIGMTVGKLLAGGKFHVDLAQKYFGILNGQRALTDWFVEQLPDLSWSRFGVEIFLSKTAHTRNIPVAEPLLTGLTHHTKGNKLGPVAGFHYRLQMYRECLYTLAVWRKYV